MRTAMTVALLAGVTSAASAQWAITETYVGIDGEDGTQDWFEVTWLGAGTGDTGTLLYDDVSRDIADAVALDSFILSTGQSAIFLIDTAAVDDFTYSSAVEEFEAIWGVTGNIGYAADGAGLGQGGDEVNVGFNDGGTFSVLASLAYTGADASGQTSVEQIGGVVRASVLGENGAFASNAFFNDNLGLPGDEAVLVGSPLSIPAPASVALLGLGGLVARRRR